MFIYFKILLVFISVVITDLIWALYIKSIAEDKLFKASLFSAIIVLCGSFTVISYTSDYLMIFPAAAGAFVGTLLSKYFIKNK